MESCPARSVSDALSPLDFDVRRKADRSESLRCLTMGPIRACHLRSAGYEVLARVDRHRAASFLTTSFQLGGALHFGLGARHKTLSAGQWWIQSDAEDYEVESPEPSEVVVLQLPRRSVQDGSGLMRRLGWEPLNAQQGAGRLLTSLVMGCFDEAPLMGTAAREALVSTVVRMLYTATVEAVPSTPQAADVEAFRQAVALIERRISEPGLGLSAIAEELQCSKRYVHRLFERYGEGFTPQAFVMRTRLLLAASALADGADAGMSIGDLAYRFGFEDPSHFSRVFRRAYGIAPSAWRAGQRAPGQRRAVRQHGALRKSRGEFDA